MSDNRQPPSDRGALDEHVNCPSCLAVNAAGNTFCEACGWNLRVPIPDRRATLWWVAIAIGIFVLIAFLLTRTPGDAPDASSGAGPGAGVTTTLAVVQELTPTSVQTATPQHAAGVENLIDGEPTTVWYLTFSTDESPTLTFNFDVEVEVEAISIRNLSDPETFGQHARVRSVEVGAGSSAPQSMEFLDLAGLQRVDNVSVTGTSITIEIRSTYFTPASPDAAPLDEVALVEVVFWGTNAAP